MNNEKIIKGIKNFSEKDSLSILLHGVKDLIIISDLDGKVIQLNNAATGLFNKVNIQKDYSNINIIDYFKNIIPGFSVEKKTADDRDIEISLNLNNNIKTFLVSISKINNDNGFTGLIFILKDITDIRISEAELKTVIFQLKKEMEQKTRMQKHSINTAKLASIGLLASGVSHEINNPLMIIYGNLTLLKEYFEKNKISDEFINNSIDKQEKSIKRIGSIVEGLRTYASIEKNDDAIIDTNHVINQTASLVKGMFEEKGINLNLELNADNAKVLGNVSDFRQVIMNLIQNSNDAFEKCTKDKKSVTIKSFNTEKEVHIEISDNGCGISEQNLALVFDTFFTTKDPNKGTGLGLSISQSILTSMKGTIDVSSKLGTGTTFIIKLPVIS